MKILNYEVQFFIKFVNVSIENPASNSNSNLKAFQLTAVCTSPLVLVYWMLFLVTVLALMALNWNWNC